MEVHNQPDDPSVPAITAASTSRIQTPPTSQVPEPVDLEQTTPSASVQLNLFGTPAPTRKKSTAPSHIDTCKDNVIMGDSNLTEFEHPSCTVFSHASGRLSHFKGLLTATKKTHDNVQRFFVCLSTLDSGNNFNTNSTTLKSLLGAARRVFPRAQAFVMLLGYDPSLPSETRSNIQALNNYVICKHPSSCLHITAPQEFSVRDHRWSNAAQLSVYDKITSCLNYE